MLSNEDISPDQQLDQLAFLLDTYHIDREVGPCVDGMINKQSRIVVGVSFDGLNKAGKVAAFFDLFASCFSEEHGRYYICTSEQCSKVFAKDDTSLSTIGLAACVCGKPLRQYYEANALVSYYETQQGFDYNYIQDDSDKMLAFSCGRVVSETHIADALLGPFYHAYREEHALLAEAIKAIYLYFDGNDERLLAPIYLADNGGVLKQARNDPRYFSGVSAPLLHSAYMYAGKRLVCINYFGSTMCTINQLLGFHVIYRVGKLAYLGLKDVTLPLLAYQQIPLQLHTLLGRRISLGT